MRGKRKLNWTKQLRSRQTGAHLEQLRPPIKALILNWSRRLAPGWARPKAAPSRPSFDGGSSSFGTRQLPSARRPLPRGSPQAPTALGPAGPGGDRGGGQRKGAAPPAPPWGASPGHPAPRRAPRGCGATDAPAPARAASAPHPNRGGARGGGFGSSRLPTPSFPLPPSAPLRRKGREGAGGRAPTPP